MHHQHRQRADGDAGPENVGDQVRLHERVTRREEADRHEHGAEGAEHHRLVAERAELGARPLQQRRVVEMSVVRSHLA